MDIKGLGTTVDRPPIPFRVGESPQKHEDSQVQVSLTGIPAVSRVNVVQLPKAGEKESAGPRTEAGPDKHPYWRMPANLGGAFPGSGVKAS